MAHDLHSVISTHLESLLPLLKFELGVVPATENEMQDSLRYRLRKDLVTELGLSESVAQDILDLKKRPRKTPAHHLSLAHSASIGLWIASTSPCGIDLERTDRVQETAVSRISQPEERALAPHPALLWCAKEAAFKAASDEKDAPKVLSQIEIRSWEDASITEHPGWRFFWRSRDSQLHGCGAATSWNGVSFSFASVSAQLWS